MNLLLIMPNFFEYPQIIKEELEDMGYDVDFFDDRPSTNAWVKAAIRVNPRLIKTYIKQYFEKMMLTVSNKVYDIVFLISGQSLSFDADMIAKVKESQPNAKFILYQWDSLKNFPHIGTVWKYFDKRYSFDKSDCNANPGLFFLPLFYSRKYEELGTTKDMYFKYDFCFVGTAHPKKYKFINMMSAQLKSIYPKRYIYFFFPSPIVYFYRKFKNPELKKAHYKEFHYKPLSGDEVYKIFADSRCVLDSPQDGQLGLTIRVFEALGAKKKLITTNEDVKNYDFYMPENIYVYDGDIDFEHVFFKNPYKEIERNIYEKYSLRNWLKELIK